jgi:hypothetical protein
LAVQGDLTSLLAFFFPPLAGSFEFAVASVQDLLGTTFEFVLGRDVADGRMQANCVVVFDELADDAACVFEGERGARANTFFLEDAMPAFDLAVALGIVRRGADVAHAANTDELLEIPGNELGTVVGDDAGLGVGKLFPGPLHDLLDIGFGHGFADLPVDGEAGTAIEEAAQVVEGAGDVDVRDIDMPVFMRFQRLDEARALGGGLGRVTVEQASPLEDTVNAGGTAGDDVPVEHHEGQAAVALVREAGMEVDNGLFLLVFEPVVAWDPGIVLVGLAVAVLPGVPLGSGQAQPQEETGDGDAGLVVPALDKIDDLVAGIVGNPESV